MIPERPEQAGAPQEPRLGAAAGLFAAAAVVALGIAWAFARGANDFSVFYEAWRLVLDGKGAQLYHATPDRYLYAPGFAWVLCFLGLLPRSLALALWCLLKAGVIAASVRVFSSARGGIAQPTWTRLGIGAWAVALLARPILIDLEYGQVNLLILGACVWALSRKLRLAGEGSSPAADGSCWFLLGIAAITKLFPLPLACIPFLWRGSRRAERMGVLLGVLLILLLPVASEGLQGAWRLLLDWRQALLDRGLPLESHDQSFTAFVYHYLSGLPTEVIAQHRAQLSLGWPLLPLPVIKALSLGWLAAWVGALAALLCKGRSLSASPLAARAGRAALLIGLLIVPSHLVWKPYFVLGLPAGVLAVGRYRTRWCWLIALAAAVNLSGFDVIGQLWAARVEAASVMLWAHLALLAVALL